MLHLRNLTGFCLANRFMKKKLAPTFSTYFVPVFSFISMVENSKANATEYWKALTRMGTLVLRKKCLYSEFSWSACGKSRTRKNPNTYTFSAVRHKMNLTVSCIMLRNGRTYFENLAVWTSTRFLKYVNHFSTFYIKRITVTF